MLPFDPLTCGSLPGAPAFHSLSKLTCAAGLPNGVFPSGALPFVHPAPKDFIPWIQKAYNPTLSCTLEQPTYPISQNHLELARKAQRFKKQNQKDFNCP